MTRLIAALALALALALVVVACGGDEGTTPAATPTPADTATATATPSAAEDGAQLFADNCSRCHGAAGGGGSGPDITGEDNLDGVVEKVTAGDAPMPSFEGQLSPEQIQAVAGYVVDQL